MKLTDLFIRRPVLAVVINLVILLAGLYAVRSLNVRQYPRSDLSVISVQTVYVGANADLVRGFLTTPLERVIASAEGIDYMESTSAQGLSTINVHLKLNFDTNAALTQIQAKVAQVRNDLPPEAEAPTIQVQTTDDQIAAMYLSFLLGRAPAQPDHRLPHARRPAQDHRVNGVHAPTSWARAPSPCASGSSPTGWRRSTSRRPTSRRPGGQQLPVRRRRDERVDDQRQPDGQHRPAQRPGVQQPRRPAERQHRHPPARHRHGGPRRGGLQFRRAFRRLDRHVHGRLGAAHFQHARRGPRRARVVPEIAKSLPTG